MKELKLQIDCCANCPYNVYIEYNDVGFSFGFDYYCKKLDMTQPRSITQCKESIRKECPLPESSETNVFNVLSKIKEPSLKVYQDLVPKVKREEFYWDDDGDPREW